SFVVSGARDLPLSREARSLPGAGHPTGDVLVRIGVELCPQGGPSLHAPNRAGPAGPLGVGSTLKKLPTPEAALAPQARGPRRLLPRRPHPLPRLPGFPRTAPLRAWGDWGSPRGGGFAPAPRGGGGGGVPTPPRRSHRIWNVAAPFTQR